MVHIGRYAFTLLVIIGIFTINSCKEDEEVNPNGNDAQSSELKRWIYDEMSFNYLWNVLLPDTYQSNSLDPNAYYNSLLYRNDRFSWITDDAESLQMELQGTSFDIGYAPEFGRFANSDRVFIIVQYVYPGSNANNVGLQRGDIIVKINGSQLTTDNFRSLYNESSQTLTLGEYNGETIETTSQTISVNASVTQMDPIIHWEIKNIDNQKTGYLAYVKFISGEGDEWLDSLNLIIDEMQQSEVSQLIVDLRYNPGGELKVAEQLGSVIAPANATTNKNIFVTLNYNDIIQELIENSEDSNAPETEIRFSNPENNLNLEQVIFLTSSHSASASELIINGLEPYMEVITIGESTVGKFYGSFVITDRNDTHNWAIVPVVMKYANANGVSDFVKGLAPDFEVEDNLLNAVPLGDERDPMLSTAISYIKGEVDITARKGGFKPYTSLPNEMALRRGNIVVAP